MALIPIASQTVGSAVNQVDFTSIPTTVSGVAIRDLVLVCSALSGGSSGRLTIQFNGDTGSNYARVVATGNGSTVTTAMATSPNIWSGESANANTTNRLFVTLNVFDFAQTNKHKAVLLRSNEALTGTEMMAARWASTSAITSITVRMSAGTWTINPGSTFNLFGVQA